VSDDAPWNLKSCQEIAKPELLQNVSIADIFAAGLVCLGGQIMLFEVNFKEFSSNLSHF
jgi:hypothetical protein